MAASVAVNGGGSGASSSVANSKVDTSRWVCVYPIYLDAKKTIAEGRRIPKEKATDQPNSIEVFEVVKLMGFEAELEMRKAYSRDFLSRGRVRVKLYDDEHKPMRKEIDNRRVLFAQIALHIPKYREKHPKKPEPKQATTKATTGRSTTGKSNKKGKKK